MAQQALTVRDLKVVSGEPRIADILLGEHLGFGRPTNIRKLVRRHKRELSGHGEISVRPSGVSEIGGRWTEEYLLNEEQALVICLHAQTQQAVAVRTEVIKVFMAYRRGLLVRVDAPAPMPSSDEDRWRANDQRLAAIERAMRGQDSVESERFSRAVAYMPGILFLTHDDGRKRRQSRPRWWHDMPVREMVIRLHRQMTVNAASAAMDAEFGRARAPSRSSLHRFWMTLDHMRAAR